MVDVPSFGDSLAMTLSTGFSESRRGIKRSTNGLPGATTRLSAMMAHRGQRVIVFSQAPVTCPEPSRKLWVIIVNGPLTLSGANRN